MQKVLISLLPILASGSLSAGGVSLVDEPKVTPEIAAEKIPVVKESKVLPEWGVAMGVRHARLPFKAADKKSSDVFPLFYYEGDTVFFRGDYAGVNLWKGERSGVNAVAKYRFFDIPEEYEDEVRGGAIDMGTQWFYQLDPYSQFQLEFLSDPQGRLHTEARWAGDYRKDAWRLFPEVELRLMGKEFNSHYYGVDLDTLDRGLEARARTKVRRRIYKNLHFEGKAELGWMGTDAPKSAVIEDDFEYEFYMGLGIFTDESAEPKRLNALPYWRVSQLWGTTSDFQNIIFGEHKTEPGVDVRATSLFYGHPLADTIFGKNIAIYLTPGVVYHYRSDVQGAAAEWVLAFKGYYTFPTPWRLRLGMAEGISYTDSLTYYESTELTEAGYRASKLLNYLDLTLDLNLGDVFKSERLENLWLGTGIHHRSGIYETSSAFGRIGGGTNFSNVYLQWHGGF